MWSWSATILPWQLVMYVEVLKVGFLKYFEYTGLHTFIRNSCFISNSICPLKTLFHSRSQFPKWANTLLSKNEKYFFEKSTYFLEKGKSSRNQQFWKNWIPFIFKENPTHIYLDVNPARAMHTLFLNALFWKQKNSSRRKTIT